MAREVYNGSVMINSKCPHGCGCMVFLRVPPGYRAANGRCPGCKKPVHVHGYDLTTYVKAGLCDLLVEVYNTGE